MCVSRNHDWGPILLDTPSVGQTFCWGFRSSASRLGTDPLCRVGLVEQLDCWISLVVGVPGWGQTCWTGPLTRPYQFGVDFHRPHPSSRFAVMGRGFRLSRIG